MDSTILIEVLKSIGRFFINPLLYIAVISAIFLGYQRVKRERKYFKTRILGGWSELKTMFFAGFVLSLIVSLSSIVIGLTVPLEFLILITLISMIGLLLFNYHLLSPIIVIAVAFVVVAAMYWQDWSFEIMGFEFAGHNVADGLAVTAPILAGVLLMAEGLLIRRYGAKFASPIVETTKRGFNGIAYYSKKIWVLPVFIIIPGDAFSGFLPYWPQFSLGQEQFSLVLFPFVIGFQQLVRKVMPKYVYPELGRSIIFIGELLLLVGFTAYFFPILGAIALALGVISRTIIVIYYRRKEDRDSYAVMRSGKGAMIAAVLPNSPAEKMGLIAGEVIQRVNGQEVFSEDELYEALQINAAHCRLEVIDHNQELRLTQHAVHNDDHHKIGVLLVK
ncbi:PDZ domain-containing protein [Solibacillus sp. FSL K6-1523]|uniref:PDZ domain-containing protein n=1 Tax=Solibacillus sp. FSL K6-1523 TaxID=2921471 RepID=UPI0030F980BA